MLARLESELMPRKNKAFGKVGTKVTEVTKDNLSLLSLADRAAASVVAELRGGDTRANLLGVIGAKPARRAPAARALPQRWSFLHVADRTEEAALVLMRLPAGTSGPKLFGSGMPSYTYDFEDLVGQIEQGELERLLKERNRPRGAPAPDAIARMHEVLGWPGAYLADEPAVARALWVAANIIARNVPERFIEDAIEQAYWTPARKMGRRGEKPGDRMNYWAYTLERAPSKHEMFRLRMVGLQKIAEGLARDRVPIS